MIISKTPFRISFFGGGTDYPVWFNEHGGSVLGSTIDKYCYISCRYLPPFFDHSYRIVYSKSEHAKDVSDIEHPSVKECIRFAELDEGLEIHHDADLPARSGLGSSSSFTVGLLHCLGALSGRIYTKMELATDAIHVEQEMIGENVGSQDQTHAALGGLNHIEFHGNNSIDASPVTISSNMRMALNDHLLLFFTNIPRFASEIAEEQIRNSLARESELKEMHGMVNEAMKILNNRVESIDDFGLLLNESWKLKRSLSTRITNDDIDAWYDSGLQAGASGGKLLGAGAGGCMLFFCEPDRHQHVIGSLSSLLHIPFRFENEGSQLILNEP